MNKLLLCSACALALHACSAGNKHSNAASDGCADVGRRLQTEKVIGIINSDISTHVRLSSCPKVEMALAFIGDQPHDFALIYDRAAKAMSIIGFQAVGDGYVVEDPSGQRIFIAITLANIREDPDISKRSEVKTTGQ